MKKLIFMIMALFGLAIAFSGCSKISLKPKKSLGPFSIIPNRSISSVAELNRQMLLRWKRYKKLGRRKVLILINKQIRLCSNFERKHKKELVKMLYKMSKIHSNNDKININILNKSYIFRFTTNCSDSNSMMRLGIISSRIVFSSYMEQDIKQGYFSSDFEN